MWASPTGGTEGAWGRGGGCLAHLLKAGVFLNISSGSPLVCSWVPSLLRSWGLLGNHCSSPTVGSPSDSQPVSKTCPGSVACLSLFSSLLLPTPQPLFRPMNIPVPFLLLSVCAHSALLPECLSTNNLWLISSDQSHCLGGRPPIVLSKVAPYPAIQ